MPKAVDLKKRMLSIVLLLIKEIEVHMPQCTGAATLHKVRYSDVRTARKVEEACSG